MYAQLEDIVFEPVTGFQSVSDGQDAVWAEHALLTGAPRLQPTALALREMGLSLRLHRQYVDLDYAHDALREYLTTHKVCRLLWGNGKLEGHFVIATLARTVEHQDELGNIISAIYSLTLLEYAGADPKDAKQREAKQRAIALDEGQPFPSPVVSNPDTCRQKVAMLQSVIRRSAKIIATIPPVPNMPMPAQVILVQTLRRVSVDLAALSVISSAQGPCTDNSEPYDAAVSDALAAANALATLAPPVNFIAYGAAHTAFQTAVTVLLTTGASFTSFAISLAP